MGSAEVPLIGFIGCLYFFKKIVLTEHNTELFFISYIHFICKLPILKKRATPAHFTVFTMFSSVIVSHIPLFLSIKKGGSYYA